VRDGKGLRVVPSPRIIGTAQDSVKEFVHAVFFFLVLPPSFGAGGLAFTIVIYKIWVYLSRTLNQRSIARHTVFILFLILFLLFLLIYLSLVVYKTVDC
jgi:hypothetical protein